MAISIGSATFNTLIAQPFSYDERDTSRGFTAKKWTVSGLLTPSEWLDLLDAYDNWRNLRIEDPDPAKSFDDGTTILLTGTGPGGSTWSVNCWFSSAPKGEQSGAYINASVEVVDALESLEIISRESEDESEPLVDLGTVTIGSGSNIATVTLLRPMESYGEGPSLNLTAAGNYYVTGPVTVRKIRDIEGTTSASGWTKIQNWYEEVIVAAPIQGTWFPITVPTATAKNKLVNSVKEIEYTIAIQLAYII